MSWGFQKNVGLMLHSGSGVDASDSRCQFDLNLQHNFNKLMINGSKAEPSYSGNRELGSYTRYLPAGADASFDATLAELVCTAPPGYQLDPPLQLSLHQLQALGSSVLGWQVMVESAEGTFVGHVCWLLDHCSRLGLEQVSRPGSDVRRVGLLLLYYRHIHQVTLLGRRPYDPHRARQQKSNVQEERTGRSLLMKKIVPLHLLEKRRDELEEEDEEALPLPSPAGGLKRPNDWRVVDALDDSYREAVSAIASCRRVGLSCAGQQIGRWGMLAWLCVATEDKVYLFDVATLGLHATLWGQPDKRVKRKLTQNAQFAIGDVDVGEEGGQERLSKKEAEAGRMQSSCEQEDRDATDATALDLDSSPGNAPEQATDPVENSLPEATREATQSLSLESLGAVSVTAAPPSLSLASALQNGGVQVVMHDARCLCDLLQHQAGVTLAALYDTQATEVYLHLLQHRGDCPAFVPSLGALLTRRLGLAPQHLLFDRAHRRHGGDCSVYFERPLPSDILVGLASSAMFLCELRHLQMYELLADLRQLTAVHASSYALRDDHTRTRVEPHMVPDSVQQLGRRTVLNCLPPVAAARTPVWGRPNFRQTEFSPYLKSFYNFIHLSRILRRQGSTHTPLTHPRA